MTLDRNLVAINAQMDLGPSGGVGTFVGALVSALANLDDSNETYLLVGNYENSEWLSSIKGPNQKLVIAGQPVTRKQEGGPTRSLFRRAVGPVLRPIRNALVRELRPSLATDKAFPQSVPVSDGFWENLDCDVVHFPYQNYTICGKPTIYNPHDLQHLHYPEYFTGGTLAWRETMYPAGCHFARTIVTASQWIKEDIVRNYGTDPGKIQVIPWAPPTTFYSEKNTQDSEDLRKHYELPERFLLYPAVTWAHKNHQRLLKAIARLRDEQNVRVNLVCTGSQDPINFPRVESLLRNLKLDKQVKFLGFLPNDDLRTVYGLCTAVIVPTLFEAASGPVFEAWQAGKPVGCSTVTSLPEQAGDAALLFDPESIGSIADAVHALWSNGDLLDELAQKGQKRLGDFSWDRTARAYRAVYRRAAHIALTEDDRKLLAWDWMRYPGGHPS